MKLSLVKSLTVILALLALTFSIIGVTPAYGSSAANIRFASNYTTPIASKILTAGRAIASWPTNVPAAEKRPVLVFLPGWGGAGAVNASVDALNTQLANEGYVTLAIGFDDLGGWSSNISAKTKDGLDLLCADASIPANCNAIALVGESYGSAQNYWVIESLRGNGYDGSTGRAIAFLSQDAGYAVPDGVLANTAAYSVAMIENLGDTGFPVDSCADTNCGARILSDAHLARGDQNVFSICPAGGSHGSRGFANWNTWVISALKTMIHIKNGVPTFTNYTAPVLAVANTCTTTQSEYTLTISSAHGAVTKNPSQATYHVGDVVQLTAIPNAGWSFANWTGNLVSSANPASVSIYGNTSVTANYTQNALMTSTPTASPVPGASSSVYGDAPVNGWGDWSWDLTPNLANTTPVHSGTHSIAVTYTVAWSGLKFGRNDPLDISAYTILRFWVHGGASGGQVVQVQVGDGTTTLTKAITPQAGTWTQVDMSLAGLSQATQLAWFNNSAGAQSTFYVDDVSFVASGALTPTPIATATLRPTRTLTRTPTRTPTRTLTRTPVIVTLTFNSVAAQDGWVLESSETSGKGGALNRAAATFNLGEDAGKKQYRDLLSFSTGNLPDNAVITSLTLKVKKQNIIGGGNPVAMFKGFMVDIKNGFFGTAATLQTSDFQAAANKSYGPFNTALVGGWYSLNLSGAGPFVNKGTTASGLTQLRLRFRLDDNNNAVANYLSLYSGNAPVAANRPQLVISYYVP